MHTHVYQTGTCYQALRINKNLISTLGIIVIIRHDLDTHTLLSSSVDELIGITQVYVSVCASQ